MGLWDNIKSRLGLGDDWDDEYDDYYEDDDDNGSAASGQAQPEVPYASPYSGRSPGVKRLDREPDIERARDIERDRYREREHLRPVPSAAEVSRVSPQVKMHIVEPRSYTEAQGIADRFKQGTPVIMNMTSTTPELAKRLIDFASGLTYGLDGGLQKVSDKVFMLTPTNVDVSDGDVRRLRDKGLFGLDG